MVLVGPCTHRSQPQLSLGNNSLLKQTSISIMTSPPPRGVCGNALIKNLVASSQHLGRSQRSRSLQTRTSRCTKIGREQANPSHAGARRGSTLVTRTGTMGRMYTDKPRGVCWHRRGAASSWGNKQGTNPAHSVQTPAHYKATSPLTAHNFVKNWCRLRSNELKT